MRAALGLTAAEAVRVLRRACRVAGGLDGKAVQEIVRDKRHALRRTPALSFHDAPADLGHVGGLSKLKRWLGERRRAFGDERGASVCPRRAVCCSSVPGCRKSLCAKAVASEWRFPLLRLDMASAFGGATQTPRQRCARPCWCADRSRRRSVDRRDREGLYRHVERRARQPRLRLLPHLARGEEARSRGHDRQRRRGTPPELLRRGRFDELFFVDLRASRRAEILAIHLRKRGRDPTHYRLDEIAAQAERLAARSSNRR